MLDLAFFSAAVLYGLAGTLFLAQLVGAGPRASAVGGRSRTGWGPGLLCAAAALHAVHDTLRWTSLHLGPFGSIREALSTLALLVVLGFLAVHFIQRRTDVVGAFVTPLTLLLLLASRAPVREAAHLGGALFALHVASTLVGTAAFTVACGMSLAYLLQERQVKRKRLGGLFQRLPPLEVLDDVGYRCVAVGLPALTLGIVTGLFVGAREATAGSLGAWRQYVGVGAWAVFAAVLLLRVVAGWRGRRAALGTILGYASALVVLAGYYLRGGVP